MRLATRLALLLLVLSTAPLALVGWLAYRSGRSAIESDTITHLTSTNILKEHEFERWIDNNERSLRELARRPLVRESAAVLASQDPADPEYQDAYNSIIEDHFGPALQEEGGFLELSIIHRENGLILLSTEPVLEGKYRENEPFFLEGKAGTYTENAGYSLSLRQVHMHVSTSIEDENGALIAVLAGRADLAEMSEIIELHTGLSASEDTYLVNAFNFFVTEPRFGEDYALNRAVRTEGVEDCLAGNDGVGFYDDYRDVPVAVIGAYHWIEERELCILTEIDQAEAYAPIDALRGTVVGLGAVVAVIVIVAGYVLARTITEPVRRLVSGAAEIGRGNLAHRIPVRGQDEIAEMAVALNVMAANLRQSLGETGYSERLLLFLKTQVITTLMEWELLSQAAIAPEVDMEGIYRAFRSFRRDLGRGGDGRRVGDSLLADIPQGEDHLLDFFPE